LVAGLSGKVIRTHLEHTVIFLLARL